MIIVLPDADTGTETFVVVEPTIACTGSSRDPRTGRVIHCQQPAEYDALVKCPYADPVYTRHWCPGHKHDGDVGNLFCIWHDPLPGPGHLVDILAVYPRGGIK